MENYCGAIFFVIKFLMAVRSLFSILFLLVSVFFIFDNMVYIPYVKEVI